MKIGRSIWGDMGWAEQPTAVPCEGKFMHTQTRADHTGYEAPGDRGLARNPKTKVYLRAPGVPRSRVYRGLRCTRYLGLHVFSKECLCITRNVLIRKKLFCEVRRMRPQVAENFADRLRRSKDPKEEGGRVDTRGRDHDKMQSISER